MSALAPDASPTPHAGRPWDFAILGVQKAGTGELQTWLGVHPQVLAHGGEVHFFDDMPARSCRNAWQSGKVRLQYDSAKDVPFLQNKCGWLGLGEWTATEAGGVEWQWHNMCETADAGLIGYQSTVIRLLLGD